MAEKASRYGELDLPYVIAINLATRFANQDTFVDSLIGTTGIAIPGTGSKENRQSDGVWFGPEGPQNTRVSAVWGINALDPWTVSRRDTCVYNTPCAALPLSRELIPVSHGFIDDELYSIHPGSTAREIFGLSEEWPE